MMVARGAAGREKKIALLLRWCSGEVRRCGGSVKDSQVQARWLQLLFSSGGGAPRRPARLAAAAVWRVVMVAEIRVRVLGDEGDDVARSEWSIG